jgi:hypothetical protein
MTKNLRGIDRSRPDAEVASASIQTLLVVD